MKYYQVGVVNYNPRLLSRFRDGIADYSDYYEIGEVVPIIICFAKSGLEKHIRKEQVLWMMNTITNLKPGDPITFNMNAEEMYRIRADPRGVGVFED